MSPLAAPLASWPVVSNTQRIRLAETRASLKRDLAAANVTITELIDELAQKHGRSHEWIRLQIGLGGLRSVNSRSPSAWSVFCGQKLMEKNEGLQKGFRFTLREFLQDYSAELREEFNTLSCESKRQLVAAHVEERGAQKGAVNMSNVQVSKLVDAKLKQALVMLDDVHDFVGTEWLLLIARGSDEHTYMPSAHFTPNAMTWLQNVSLQRIPPVKAAAQLDSFITSGHVETTSITIAKEVRTKSRDEIQNGLKKILEVIKHPHPSMRMNYASYFDIFKYGIGIKLKGWLLPGSICNPGRLSVTHAAVLLTALRDRRCYWVRMPSDEWERLKADVDARQQNGETVLKHRKKRARKDTSGPPLKRACIVAGSDDGSQDEGNDEDDEDEQNDGEEEDDSQVDDEQEDDDDQEDSLEDKSISTVGSSMSPISDISAGTSFGRGAMDVGPCTFDMDARVHGPTLDFGALNMSFGPGLLGPGVPVSYEFGMPGYTMNAHPGVGAGFEICGRPLGTWPFSPYVRPGVRY
ncbi:hypothetical protein K488DRAFT_74891 [Vararia minispora EC-137]|uniref:Uncharacterized protein n=1 Tax=Vararia minispora EC-137 TaxID=1314806 RepID=A0ACB8Q5I9_9AGAM|nr:hypothetical protein K488DRAFT_74891 [Vararia minispora EC-137]